jgi:hypothetical protein
MAGLQGEVLVATFHQSNMVASKAEMAVSYEIQRDSNTTSTVI